MPYRVVHLDTRECRAFAAEYQLATWLKAAGIGGRRDDLAHDLATYRRSPDAKTQPLVLGPLEIHLDDDPAWGLGARLLPRADGRAADGVRVYDTDNGEPAPCQ